MPHTSLLRLLCIALLAALMAAPEHVEAQQDDQDGRRGQRGGRGFGGPGFGGRGFGGQNFAANPMFLLRVDKVRDELDVTEDQRELISILGDEIREAPGRPEFGNFREMSEEERAEFGEKMAKWVADQNAKAKESLKTILKPEQYKRLQEITIQQQGVDALFDSEVVAALEITEDQQTKLEETRDAIAEEQRAAREERRGQRGERGNFDFQAFRERMEEARKEREEKLLAVLTDDQKEAFTALKGEEFELSREDFGFGRGRGGQGGRRGGGRPGRPGGGDRPERPE